MTQNLQGVGEEGITGNIYDSHGVFMGSKQLTLQLSSPVSDLWSTLFGRLFLGHVKHWFKEYPK